MGEHSKIEWTDHTFNPWVGCTKVSPACDHCYAESWAKRTGSPELWGGMRRRTSAANWRQPVRWARAAAAAGKRARVFCASLADVFDNEVPTAWRVRLFDLIAATPNLDWLLLTKRIGNVENMVGDECAALPNIWLGSTVVNQAEVDRDVPRLLATPARVRFLSMEPLLGSVNIARYFGPQCDGGSVSHPEGGGQTCGICMGDRRSGTGCPGVDWVIVGGESGAGARPMDPGWAMELRVECRRAGVPFFFKQGSAANWPAYKDPSTFPESLVVREFPA